MDNLKYLKWESDFFKKKIYSVIDLNESLYFSNFDYDLIQTQIDLNSKGAISKLEENKFKVQELNITFKKKIDKGNNKKYLFGTIGDYYQLKEFGKNFINSRFMCFGIEKVEHFYRVWIKNSLNGAFDDCCLIYKRDEDILGFVTIKKNGKNTGKIGLISVREDSFGRGIGSELIAIAEEYCFNHGIKELFVSTQGTNLPAQNLYIKNSYFIDKITAWYYLKGEKL